MEIKKLIYDIIKNNVLHINMLEIINFFYYEINIHRGYLIHRVLLNRFTSYKFCAELKRIMYICVKLIYIFVRQDYKKLLVNQVSQGDFFGKICAKRSRSPLIIF